MIASPAPEINSAMIDAARDLRSGDMGIVWLAPGQKVPTRKGWTLKSQEPKDYQPGANLGLMCGRISNDLVCVDLDSAKAIELADEYLPATEMIDGRKSKPRSHRWYLVTDVPPDLTSTAAEGLGGPRILHYPAPAKIDVLGTGAQTVVPPSVHQSGEPREWESGQMGVPAVVDCQDLYDRARRLAIACGWEERPASTYTPSSNGASHYTNGHDVEKRVIAWLDATPGAMAEQGGHNHTMAVVRAVVYEFDLGPDRGYDLLQQHWNHKCQPPWTEPELRHKCRDADTKAFDKPRGWKVDQDRRQPEVTSTPAQSTDGDQQPAEPQPRKETASVPLTDDGNGRRFAKRFGGNVRYCYPRGAWYQWTDKFWEIDERGAVMFMGKTIPREMFEWAKRRIDELSRMAAEGDEEAKNKLAAIKELLAWALKSQHVQRLKAMIDLARSEPGIPVMPADLDRNPWLLNCQNGMVDLRTGKLLPHDRAELCTKVSPVQFDPDAKAPRWMRFLDEVMDGDPELTAYLARAAGYSASASQKEQCLFFNYGTGRNGKSKFLGAIEYALGDYAVTGHTDLLTVRHGEPHPTERAALFGRRFVSMIETEDNKRLAESLVKQLTGGDTITARFMRQDFFTFSPTHHIWIGGNYKPKIVGQDEGIWRRIKLIPWQVNFEGREEKDLDDVFRAEAQGILAWLVRGALEWQEMGLSDPAVVSAATKEYRTDQDRLGAWLEEACYVGPQAQRRASELYANYRSWAEKGGEFIVSQMVWGNEMTRRGFGKKTNNGVWRTGIDLKSA